MKKTLLILVLILGVSIIFVYFKTPSLSAFYELWDWIKFIDRLYAINISFALLLVIVGFWIIINGFLKDKDRGFRWIIKIYLGGAMAMSSIYFGIYVYNPNLYSISSDVDATSKIQKYEDNMKKIKETIRRIGMVYYYYDYVLNLDTVRWIKLESPKDSVQNIYYSECKDLKISYVTNLVETGLYFSLTMQDSLGPINYSENSLSNLGSILNEFKNPEKLHQLNAISKLINYEENALIPLIREFNSQNKIRSLNIFDFIYFSIITIATVGYGDIVPNNTITRVFVIIQVLFGIILLTRSDKKDQRKANNEPVA